MKTPKLHLQGIGDCYAVPALYARVGDTLIWNYGPDKGPILSITQASPHFFFIETEASSYQRRVKTTRPLVIQHLHQTYHRERRATLKELRSHETSPIRLERLKDAAEGYDGLIVAARPTAREELARLHGQQDAFNDYLLEHYREMILARAS